MLLLLFLQHQRQHFAPVPRDLIQNRPEFLPLRVSDMTWGLMYVPHGLGGVGLIALVMMHVYFGLRPEKRAITKSMIFGRMDRDFYLEEHDPERWKVETASSSPTSNRIEGRGLTDAG